MMWANNLQNISSHFSTLNSKLSQQFFVYSSYFFKMEMYFACTQHPSFPDAVVPEMNVYRQQMSSLQTLTGCHNKTYHELRSQLKPEQSVLW